MEKEIVRYIERSDDWDYEDISSHGILLHTTEKLGMFYVHGIWKHRNKEEHVVRLRNKDGSYFYVDLSSITLPGNKVYGNKANAIIAKYFNRATEYVKFILFMGVPYGPAWASDREYENSVRVMDNSGTEPAMIGGEAIRGIEFKDSNKNVRLVSWGGKRATAQYIIPVAALLRDEDDLFQEMRDWVREEYLQRFIFNLD